MKYIKAFVISFSIWIVSALINGLLCCIYIAIAKDGSAGMILFTTGFSLLFSIPGIIVFCIFFWINLFMGKQNNMLFRRLVAIAFVCSLFTGLLFFKALQYEFEHDYGAIICLATVAAVIAVFIHRGSILSFFKTENHEQFL